MKRLTGDRLYELVESYFRDHLQRARGSSPHTVRAYGHGLRLFITFLAQRGHRSVARLHLDDIRVEAVLAFLDHLEADRKNTAASRNCRLAAVRGFVEHLLRHDLARAEQYQRILAVRRKRAPERVVHYLEPDQVRLILAQPQRGAVGGVRDRALLMFLYNTGARVSEALAVTQDDLHLTSPRHVRLHGKGKKDRICPLWPETVAALRDLLRQRTIAAGPIFRNARGGTLSRDGVAYILSRHAVTASAKAPVIGRHRITPHVLRHSCAVALLQAGVDLTVIRDYLGHVSVATTNRYVKTNVAMKRDAIEALWRRAGIKRDRAKPWRPTARVLEFLSSL